MLAEMSGSTDSSGYLGLITNSTVFTILLQKLHHSSLKDQRSRLNIKEIIAQAITDIQKIKNKKLRWEYGKDVAIFSQKIWATSSNTLRQRFRNHEEEKNKKHNKKEKGNKGKRKKYIYTSVDNSWESAIAIQWFPWLTKASRPKITRLFSDSFVL